MKAYKHAGFILGLVVLILMIVAGCRLVSSSSAGITGGESNRVTGAASDAAKLPSPRIPPTTREAPPPTVSPRWWATADVVSATVMRVEGVAQATPGPRLAGYLIRPGTEQPLSPEHTRELVELVRFDSGFDDSIVKRCRPAESVGFRLLREGPSGTRSSTTTELVLCFGCEKLSIAVNGTDIHATYFDPSRNAFLSFVTRILPEDEELRKLR